MVIEDKKIVIAKSDAADNTYYQDAGIYLGNESSPFKYIKYSGSNWEFDSHLNLTSGNSFKINSTSGT